MNQNYSEEVRLADEGTPMAVFQKERTDAISEMFSNKFADGIYPTSIFFARIDNCVEKLIHQARVSALEEAVETINQEIGSGGVREYTFGKEWTEGYNQAMKDAIKKLLPPDITNI